MENEVAVLQQILPAEDQADEPVLQRSGSDASYGIDRGLSASQGLAVSSDRVRGRIVPVTLVMLPHQVPAGP